MWKLQKALTDSFCTIKLNKSKSKVEFGLTERWWSCSGWRELISDRRPHSRLSAASRQLHTCTQLDSRRSPPHLQPLPPSRWEQEPEGASYLQEGQKNKAAASCWSQSCSEAAADRCDVRGGGGVGGWGESLIQIWAGGFDLGCAAIFWCLIVLQSCSRLIEGHSALKDHSTL